MSAIAYHHGTSPIGVTTTTADDDRKPHSAVRFGVISAVVAFKLIVLVCLWGGLFVYLSYEKDYAFRNAERDGASFTRALEEHTLNTVRGIDQTTVFVKDQYERIGNKLDLDRYGRQGTFLAKYFNLIGIFDPQGQFVMADRPLPKSNIADREHFQTHIAADSGQMFISKPVLGRSSGKWAVQFTRRINTRSGGFGGVVVSSLDPGYFAQFYHSIDIGENGVVTLVGTDGIVRARSNGKDNGVGQDLHGTRLFREMQQHDAGSFFTSSAIDGVRRFVSFRKLPEYPLFVTVGISENAALKEYREHRDVLLVFGGLITLLIVSSGIAFTRQMRYQQRVEQSLRDSEHEARSANKLKSEFLANMSHELRTPMHSILSFAELGLRRKDGPADAEKIARYLARIQQSGKRLLSLLNDLLDLSKLEAGRMQFKPGMHPIRPVVDQVAEEMAALLKCRGLTVRVSSEGTDAQAYFDLSKVAQVLHNLLGNASKFSPQGCVIEVSFTENQRGALAVSVRDSGPGIPADELELVFEQFIQSSKTKTGAGGTGLGLAICRQIVEAHGGHIKAANNPNGGANFTFTLPLVPPAKNTAANPPQKLPS